MKESNEIDLDTTMIEHPRSDVESRPRHPYLVIFIGQDSGKRYRLQPGKMTIGRSTEADITIDDEWASRIHCTIDWADDVIRVEDNGSTNGIFIDYRRTKSASLTQGVPLQIGHSVMKVDYKDEAEIRLEEKLLRNACIDGLTGISNRQQFMRRAVEEFSYARRNERSVAIIMIDIDKFKNVNDTHGHQMGDFALNRFAGIINGVKRKEDIFARYGGEEFVMIPVGQIHLDEVYGFCERLRKAIEISEFQFGDVSIQLTASFGFHIRNITNGDQIEPLINEVIKKADKALYRAKNNGRNCIEYLL
jgi:diguanylate cyclase (GGDEF)-like protein